MERLRQPATPDFGDAPERYPGQRQHLNSLAQRLKGRGIETEPDGLALTVRHSRIEVKPVPSDRDALWFFVDGTPIDPVGSPDAPMRVADELRRKPQNAELTP